MAFGELLQKLLSELIRAMVAYGASPIEISCRLKHLGIDLTFSKAEQEFS
jgi:hypothetical protein